MSLFSMNSHDSLINVVSLEWRQTWNTYFCYKWCPKINFNQLKFDHLLLFTSPKMSPCSYRYQPDHSDTVSHLYCGEIILQNKSLNLWSVSFLMGLKLSTATGGVDLLPQWCFCWTGLIIKWLIMLTHRCLLKCFISAMYGQYFLTWVLKSNRHCKPYLTL